MNGLIYLHEKAGSALAAAEQSMQAQQDRIEELEQQVMALKDRLAIESPIEQERVAAERRAAAEREIQEAHEAAPPNAR